MATRKILAAALLLTISCWSVTVAAAKQQLDNVKSGSVLVQFREGVVPQSSMAKTGLAGFDRTADRFRVHRIEEAFPSIRAAAAKRDVSVSAQDLMRVYEVYYNAPFDPRLVAEEFARDPNVEHAGPRLVYHLAWEGLPTDHSGAVPDDPKFGDQTHFELLRMMEAWDIAKGEDGDAVIAIADTGTEWEHPDLLENVWTNPGEIPDNGVDDDGNGYIDDIVGWNFGNDSADPRGVPREFGDHGTMVAGAATAVTNNAMGIAGAGWNAKFMPINATCIPGGAICYGLDAVVYAAMNGADVVTASWGSRFDDVFLKAAIRMALDEGVLVVAASGNAAVNVDVSPFFPSDFREVLSVGGTAKDSDRNQFNYGRGVNVFAPSAQIDATSMDGGYSTASGTSFAVPLVAGIAALVKTAFPSYGPRRIMEQIRLTADDIEDANPQGLKGLLGRGRVNAYRAVTESPPPGIRLEEWTWADSDGDSDLRSGETVQVTATFTNYGGDAMAVLVGLETASQFVDFVHAREAVGAMPHGSSHTATFEFTFAANTPANYHTLIFTSVTDGEFQDSPDKLRFSINEANVATHNTDALVTSITNEGNIGYIEFQGSSNGRGFQVRDRNGQMRDTMSEGGLLLGTGPDTVSDCVRGVNTERNTRQHKDLVLKPGTSIVLTKPGDLASQHGRVELVDSRAQNPLGLNILQESYVDSAPENEDFLIVKYTVTNTSEESSLSNLYIGLFFDWDVGLPDPTVDVARYDSDRMVGYVMGDPNSSVAVGVKVLTSHAGISYGAMRNEDVVYSTNRDGGFTEEEKWAFLSGGIGNTELEATDVSQLTGTGPFSLLPMNSVIVAFAIVGGSSEADFLQNADNAQTLWNNVLNVERTSLDPVPEFTSGFTFRPVFPNPGASHQTFSFSIPTESHVQLEIFNMLGSQVNTLESGLRPAGMHQVIWNGNDAAGRRVANGIYIARLAARSAGKPLLASQPVVVLR